jgi:hypothetical protein
MLRMALPLAHGFDIPFTMPSNEDGKVLVKKFLFNSKFNFCIRIVYVEEEIYETFLKLKIMVVDFGFFLLETTK